ncbi:MAG: NAD(P)H-quinone oxidoreductase [Deltaproteobacteria bacterium]|nr:MAG: NAD(P)H-quinone oxidoreductase [Deltaproteobacteria bacterium]
MNAIAVEGERLVLRPIPAPRPGPLDVRIQVAATAVNRADLHQRAGRYPPPPGASPILGLECAGTVIEVGAEVRGVQEGDRVAALLAGGGYAEQVVCPASHLLPVPDALPTTLAAALPEALCTAFLNLAIEGQLKPDERVLLHAGASGVGTIALQLLRAWGNPAWVTVGSPAKVQACLALGARGGSDRHAGPWLADVLEFSGGRGVDVILDPVGGPYLADNQRALATLGRLVLIGLLGGRSGELDLGRLLVKRQRVVGSVLRSRSDEEKASLIARIRAEVWPLCVEGTVRPLIDHQLPLTEAERAHARIASNETIGKVVLIVDPDQC